jgi:hypothetical protein
MDKYIMFYILAPTSSFSLIIRGKEREMEKNEDKYSLCLMKQRISNNSYTCKLIILNGKEQCCFVFSNRL